MKEALEFFENCLYVITDGVDPDNIQQKSFIAWQVRTWSVFPLLANFFLWCRVIPIYCLVYEWTYISYPCVQTPDLLRLMYNGFFGLCTSFIANNPDYFIVPVRVNGSAMESYFSSAQVVNSRLSTKLQHKHLLKLQKQLQRNGQSSSWNSLGFLTYISDLGLKFFYPWLHSVHIHFTVNIIPQTCVKNLSKTSSYL